MKCLTYFAMAASASAMSLAAQFTDPAKKLDAQGVAEICETIKCETATCVEPFKLVYEDPTTGLPSCCGACKAPEDVVPLPTTFFKSKYLVDSCPKKPDTCNHETGTQVQCFQQNCAEGEEEQCGKDSCCPQCGKWNYVFSKDDNAWIYELPA